MTASEITKAIGPLVTELSAMGIRVSGSRYDAQSFGNFYVDFKGPKGTFRIVRDRSQYFLDGDVEDIKKRGYFQAYNTVEEFAPIAVNYARAFA